mgnify:CR=1 FL=1
MKKVYNYLKNLFNRQKQEFPKGSFVKVVGCGANASDFLEIGMSPMGVYSVEDWELLRFEVVGKYKEITFEHNPKIYGAYPIGLNGKVIGYVYNNALKKA